MDVHASGAGVLAARSSAFRARTRASRSTATASTRSLSLKETLEEQFPWVREWEQDLTKSLSRLRRAQTAEQRPRLRRPAALLARHDEEPGARADVAGNFDHVLVDEYQDTNKLQGEILQALKPDGAGRRRSSATMRRRSIPSAPPPWRTSSASPSASSRGRRGGHAGAELPFHAAGARRCQRADGGGARQHRKTCLATRGKRQRARLRDRSRIAGRRRSTSCGKILQRAKSAGRCAGRPILFRSSHHSDVLEVELARRNDALREVRRPQVPRGRARQGHACRCCAGPTIRATAWRDSACCKLAARHRSRAMPSRRSSIFEAQGFAVKSLADFDAPQLDENGLEAILRADREARRPATPWPGQVGLVRDWYKPQLERLYEQRSDAHGRSRPAGAALRRSMPRRERFLTELTLDPPEVTSDQSRRRLQG